MNMLFRSLFVLILFLLPCVGYGQYFPDTAWTRCYGGSLNDGGGYISQTFDGGYIVLGTSYSDDGDLMNCTSGAKLWILKLDNAGNIMWQRTEQPSFGAKEIRQTSDSGYIYGGNYQSTKLDVNGNVVWQDSITASYALQTFDGGYAFADGARVIKISSTFSFEWDYFNFMDPIYSLEQTADSGLVMATFYDQDQGPDNHNFIKINKFGNLEFGSGVSNGSSFAKFTTKPTMDNKFVSVGSANDYTDSWGYIRKGGNSFYWYRTMFDRFPTDVTQRLDSGFVFCGIDTSYKAIMSRTDADGYEVVTRHFGGSGNTNRFSTLFATKDSGYIVVGTTNSNDGDVWGNHGQSDLWIVKFKRDTSNYAPPVVQSVKGVSKIDEVKVYPNPSSGVINVAFASGEKAVFGLVNIVGQSVPINVSVDGKNYQISITDQPTGQYILQISTGTERKSYRITYMP